MSKKTLNVPKGKQKVRDSKGKENRKGGKETEKGWPTWEHQDRHPTKGAAEPKPSKKVCNEKKDRIFSLSTQGGGGNPGNGLRAPTGGTNFERKGSSQRWGPNRKVKGTPKKTLAANTMKG